MNIAFIGPGIMPIPPNGWGAVEMLIWDYATVLTELGHSGVIINTPDRQEILHELKQEKFDIIHLHYDVFHDIILEILDLSNGKLIISSHYPFINYPNMWPRDNYNSIINSYTNNKEFHIFCSSQKDINTFVEFGANKEHCWLSKLGILPTTYKFQDKYEYDKTLCLSQICDRKRQYLIQDFENIDFIGRLESGRFINKINYRGEIPREDLNDEITKYSNFTLLSSVENTTPLAVKEALVCGLGVVISEEVSVELDTDLDFIDVIPENKIDDPSYINIVLERNKRCSIQNRKKIREYGIKSFGLKNILENEYIPKLQSLL
jgi:hypothetical protein